MWISLTLLWVVLICVVLSILALTRQVGLLHERLAPLGALAIENGLEPGDVAPRLTVNALDGAPLEIAGARAAGGMQMLLFVAPSCPVCKTLLPTARSFAAAETLDLVFVGDGDAREYRQLATAFGIEFGRVVLSPEAGRAYRVGKLPHAVLIAESGLIVAQGLVNTREHLESLMVVHESGLKSVQEYLKNRKSVNHA